MSNQEPEKKAQEHGSSDAAPKNAAAVYEKIEQGIVNGYKKIENGVVSGYKKIENSVVNGFNKVTDQCVEKLFAKDGESVEDAKKRLSGKE